MVRARHDPDRDLLALAERQQGVVVSEQLAGHGLSRRAAERLVNQGQWQRLERSVYLTRPGEPEWTAWAWAGVLLGGDRARLGGTAAGFVHGLVEAEPRPITVLVPGHQVNRSRPPWQFRREQEGLREARSPGSPPSTTLEDTVLDLCDDASVQQVVGWVTTAVQSRRTTPAALRRALRRRQRARHRRLLEELLVDVARGAESPLEVRYRRDVEKAHGLPEGQRQEISVSAYRRDIVYQPYGLVVELDGRLGHTGMGRFRDMWRDNQTLLAGQPTLRYGTVDVAGSSCGVSVQVATLLHRLGWDGLETRCRLCFRVPGVSM